MVKSKPKWSFLIKNINNTKELYEKVVKKMFIPDSFSTIKMYSATLIISSKRRTKEDNIYKQIIPKDYTNIDRLI